MLNEKYEFSDIFSEASDDFSWRGPLQWHCTSGAGTGNMKIAATETHTVSTGQIWGKQADGFFSVLVSNFYYLYPIDFAD